MLVSMGHTVVDSDLYRMGFRPVLDERDFPDRALADRFVPSIEIRRALSNEHGPGRDRGRGLEKLRAADLVVFQFPLWWSSVPAILKGWFDRVLSFAHVADTEGMAGRPPYLRGKKAMLVTTLEAPEEVYAAGSQSGLRDLLAPISVNTIAYVGMTVLPMFIVYGATPEKAAEWAASQTRAAQGPPRAGPDRPMRVLVASSSATVLPLDRSIRPGEGAVLSAHSQKVAVTRDDAGALHTLDPACRHMGCTVNWNPAEKTWDARATAAYRAETRSSRPG